MFVRLRVPGSHARAQLHIRQRFPRSPRMFTSSAGVRHRLVCQSMESTTSPDCCRLRVTSKTVAGQTDLVQYRCGFT
jgi:hypothetical protein